MGNFLGFVKYTPRGYIWQIYGLLKLFESVFARITARWTDEMLTRTHILQSSFSNINSKIKAKKGVKIFRFRKEETHWQLNVIQQGKHSPRKPPKLIILLICKTSAEMRKLLSSQAEKLTSYIIIIIIIIIRCYLSLSNYGRQLSP